MIEIIGQKWVAVVLFALGRERCRLSELVDLICGISRRAPARTLRRLQGYGLVDCHAGAREVGYVLTRLGPDAR
ncbi:winged helix-turn-helix transcriptional regulator [Streptomyces sp. NPDC091387]|uniref:winged helix-turn-helix transcriptional regulator n=1 Tax=Streptomyces sp. NPDC091387 TaxID=3365998 RepID=UPI003818A2C5